MSGPDPIARRVWAARLSVAVGMLLLVVKTTAFLLTGSSIVLSDALESVVHVGATLFMFWCLRYSLRPPDLDHPYGHGKVEYFSVGFEGGMVALAALAVFWQVGHDLWSGDHQVHGPSLGFALTGVAAAINLALGLYLLRVGRATGSAILVGDALHVLSDVWTSAGALLGLGLVWLTGDPRFDTWLAAALGAYILWAGLTLVRTAVGGLMDQVDPKVLARVVEAINEIREPEWLDCHNLRLRSSGDLVYVDFHLVVPADWSVARAHSAIERLETHILARLGRAGAVLVHLDHPGSAEYRAIAAGGPAEITLGSATRAEPVA
jgi:cation diffusion facilitator family transporter